jgi:outer membrane immunogenic protein
MILSTRASAASDRARPLGVCVLAGLLLAASAARASADDFLRGSFSTPVHWDGVLFGAQLGLSNMQTDFGNSSAALIAYSLRDTTVENEFAPSSWTTLPSNTTNGKQFGAFLGYNSQWDQIVLGLDMAYNRASSTQSSASDSISRIVTTSDTYVNTVSIVANSSLQLIDYATVRARAGYARGQFLPYFVFGAAVGRLNYSTTATTTVSGSSTTALPATYGPNTDTQSNSKNNAIVGGFVIGLGMDVAILPNLFLRGEWEYVGFAPVSGIRANLNSGRIGIGVHF